MKILQPLWEIGKCLWVPLKRQMGYVRKLQENFEKLNREAKDLYSKGEDVNREIESNKISKMPTSECEVWLKKMYEIEIKVKGIEAEFHDNKKCFGERCPNIWRRMKLGKRVTTVIDDILKLKENNKFRVVVDRPPKIIEPIPAPIIEVETSFGHTVQNILRCLRDDEIRKIGVFGMGGVGKTTIVKNLFNSGEIVLKFEIVIWVTVSKDWTKKKVQKDIARQLSLKLDDESDDSAASKIFQKLRTKKFFFLLDDVWAKVNLEALGIPSPTKENGCKIVLTTRSLSVCRQMDTDKDIKVNVLSEKEAWNLFHMKAGDVVNSSDIKPLAKEIVKECGGLPFVLVVVGLSLRNINDVHVWSNAITELRRATFQIGDDMGELVFLPLKFSFDRLKNENVKNCFLYCALYPEDFEIDVPELIEHWWVEGFIDGKLNFGEVYDKGHDILNCLTNASLLERIEDYRHRLVKVKMHDVIRDLALRITSPLGEGFGRFVVNAGAGRRDRPNEEEWEQAERMSLMYLDSEFLPEKPKCNLLKTLLLQHISILEKIPDSFFEHMHGLEILNLSGTDIRELPSSLLNLASLRGLYLTSCRYLYTLPSEIGNLTRLEVLHLGPSFNNLPIEVGQLIRLRSLRMEFPYIKCETLSDVITVGVLSRLTLLEELRILVDEKTFRLWFNKYIKDVGEELVLQIWNWNEPRFTSFRFVVEIFSLNDQGRDRYMQLSADDAISNAVIWEELNKKDVLCIQNMKTCKKLSDFYSMEIMNVIESCKVGYCDAIETLIVENGFLNLQVLHVGMLRELRTIWGAPVLPQSVTCLRYLSIWHCPKLSNIFSQGMIHHLSNLESLSVEGCSQVAEIMNEEDMAMVVNNEEDVAIVLFPRLKMLKLWGLPKLVRICKRVPNPIAWPSLEKVYIDKCPKLKNLHLSGSLAPALTNVTERAVGLEYEDMSLNNMSTISRISG